MTESPLTLVIPASPPRLTGESARILLDLLVRYQEQARLAKVAPSEMLDQPGGNV